ncbi:hypothetical protein CKA34_10615 [Rhizobium sp. 11515TR]|nr:hypothetical protein CKA34_10615 [Rhizobium sp. 11515TR]
MRAGGIVILIATLAVTMPCGARASDADRWPIAVSPMMDLQPLPDEAFSDPVAFCRGILFAAQPIRSTPKGDAIAIMASNGHAVCYEDGRAEIIRK